MGILIRPSDLQYRYHRNVSTRDRPKFRGKPDAHLFDRDDLYEILPMFSAVMDELESNDGTVLHRVEEILNSMPGFIVTREDTFDFLVGCAREMYGQ
jgi:hypothetical protein